jgi:hypothetical protein
VREADWVHQVCRQRVVRNGQRFTRLG